MREMSYARHFAKLVFMDILLMNQLDSTPEKKKIQGILPDLCMQLVDE